MKRIFVAVDISEEARRQVFDYETNLRNDFPEIRVGWEKAEKLHLTLKFLGDCEEKQLSELERIVGEISTEISNFKLNISETGIFPNARSPRVLWIDVKGETGNLEKLNNLLEIECEKIGFEREKRRFVPHLTIGRIREPYKSKELAKAHLENKFESVEFTVSEIVIYESRLQPTGSIYSVVYRKKLGGN